MATFVEIEFIHLEKYCTSVIFWAVLITATASTSDPSETDRDMQYTHFTEENMTSEQLEQWLKGRPCMTSEQLLLSNGTPEAENRTTNVSYIYCPMWFEDESFTECCGPLEKRRCCQSTEISDTVKWVLGVGVLSVVITLVSFLVCYLNNHLQCRRSTERLRTKMRPYSRRTSISPIDRRLLLKTANYTVEQIWNRIVVSFQNAEFFTKFSEILRMRHSNILMKKPRKETAEVSTVEKLALYIDNELHLLIVEGNNKTTWLNIDFQSICKNVHVTEITEIVGDSFSRNRSLLPRLPTIGEEYYQEGDYSVKLTSGEIEIKFYSETAFNNFKRALLCRYPVVTWTKYLQRDCAIIQMDNEKTVTLHLWESICSLWFSGPGRKDWYYNDFQEIYKYASQSSIEASYVVKQLMDGYEIEFVTMEYVMKLKKLIERDYPKAVCEDSSLCHVIKLDIGREKVVTLHVPRSGSLERKIWLYSTPHCTKWYNEEFRRLLAEIEASIGNNKSVSYPPDDQLTPVESSF